MKINSIIFTFIIFLLFSCDYCTDESRGDTFEWQFSDPEDQNINANQIELALNEAENRSSIYAVLVARNGSIVAERYYRGYTNESAFNIRSVSKSFLSAITGIAYEEGYIENLDDKMINYFPEYQDYVIDNRINDISIDHLLTMQGGMTHEHNNYMDLYLTNNWIRSTLEWPLSYYPGERMSYNTFHTHLLSGILTKATSSTTLDYGEEVLFDPLGIEIRDWEQDHQGIYFGGNSMFFTTRDMAALGHLYLNDGEINGIQIVPKQWVDKSLENSVPEWQSGWSWGSLSNGGYGYLWWLGELRGYEVFMAIGHGGQFVACFPELDMVIAINSNAYLGWTAANTNELIALDLIANWILPAVN
jgi:CubicO group peptidase (beta-lactamase class C family)